MARKARQSVNSYTLDLQDVARLVDADIDLVLAKAMKIWAKDLRRSTVAKKELRAVNDNIAKGARNAVYQDYITSEIGRRPSYRTSGRHARFSGNAMNRALLNSPYIRSDIGGIRFGNKKVLDRDAAQWYRLNFGAGEKASTGSPPPEVPMTFFRRKISKRVNLRQFGPSRPFIMPAGIFSSSFNPVNSPGRFKKPTGFDAFYLLQPPGQRFDPGIKVVSAQPTEGIKAHHFLEAGANYINTNYPPEVERMTRAWHAQAKLAMKAAKSKTK